MSENFERHRLTRWVKADMPSYGDEWGTEYDDSEHEHEHEHEEEEEEEIGEHIDTRHPFSVPVNKSTESSPLNTVAARNIGAAGHPEGRPMETPAHPLSSSTLVLSVDATKFAARSGDLSDDDTSDDAGAGFVRPPNTSSGLEGPPTKRPQGKLSVQTADATSKTAAVLAQDLLPPTPTYQTLRKFLPESPETDATDRSYLSDADSIQREPDRLNVRTFEHGNHVDLSEAAANLPVPFLVLDPQEMDPKTNASPRSRASEEMSSASMSTGEQFFLEPAKSSVSQAAPETLVLSIDRLNLADSDDSSFDDLNLPTKTEQLHPDVTVQAVLPQKEEDDDWGYNSEHSSNFDEQDASLVLPQLPPHRVQSPEVSRHRVKTDALDSLIDDLSKMEGDTSLFEEREPTHLLSPKYAVPHNRGLLPTLDSIQNFQLPDFENHSFNDGDTSKDYIPSLPQSARNDTIVSRARAGSIRKPPPSQTQPENDVGIVRTFSSDTTESESSTSHGIIEEKTDVESNEGQGAIPAPGRGDSVSEKAVLSQPENLDLAPPPVSKGPDVNRRASTISTATFNLGNWKPKTNMYRDQFVNDNDNESQMNISLYNKDDSTYKKFTRMGSVFNYAPSISNSSCISVPDTVETNLGQINEDQLDGEYPDTMSVAKSYHPVTSHDSSDHSLGSSILHDHTYEKKFQEHSLTPVASADDLHPITEEAETKEIPQTSQPGPRKKYPVSNWKKIMSTSQPVDRIALLKKARIDEANYETGLSQWLRESLKSTDSPHTQISELATQAYKNAQHSDIRRHTSIRSKVNLVRDKMETGNLGIQASSLGKRFFSRGKKLIKQSSD